MDKYLSPSWEVVVYSGSDGAAARFRLGRSRSQMSMSAASEVLGGARTSARGELETPGWAEPGTAIRFPFLEVAMTEKDERFVGIDVSKQTLQVCVLPDSVQRCFDNSPSGHLELRQYLACLLYTS